MERERAELEGEEKRKGRRNGRNMAIKSVP